MSEQTMPKPWPKPGEWWFHNTTSDRLYIVGHSPDGYLVCMSPRGGVGFYHSLGSSNWHHEPDCTGWDWQPKPVESPDEWVILDPVIYAKHVPRVGIDQFESCGLDGEWITQEYGHTRNTVGHCWHNVRQRHRCRRKDLPPVPPKTRTVVIRKWLCWDVDGREYMYFQSHKPEGYRVIDLGEFEQIEVPIETVPAS